MSVWREFTQTIQVRVDICKFAIAKYLAFYHKGSNRLTQHTLQH